MSAKRSRWAQEQRRAQALGMKLVTDHEPSMWLRQALDDRIRQAVLSPVVLATVAGMFRQGGGRVAFTLSDPPRDPGERARWEFTCDRCGTFVPEPNRGTCAQLVPIVTIAPITFDVSVWLCPDCARREAVTAR